MKVKFKKRTLNIAARKVTELGKFTGLMFKTRETENLLFEFKNDTRTPIHSHFVFFPFLALWLDKNNNVNEFLLVNPFRSIIRPREKFRKLVEIPINRRNSKIIEFFVGKGKV